MSTSIKRDDVRTDEKVLEDLLGLFDKSDVTVHSIAQAAINVTNRAEENPNVPEEHKANGKIIAQKLTETGNKFQDLRDLRDSLDRVVGLTQKG